MNKRIKKKHTLYGKMHLKQYHRHDQSLPFAWFKLCEKIRDDLGHPIGKKRKPLERYFRRKYYWTDSQCEKFWTRFNYDIKMTNNPFELYNTMVDDMTSLQEKYEDTVILDYLEEHLGG
jgi:hypothetical protein